MACTKTIPTIAYIGGARRPGSIRDGYRWKGRLLSNEARGAIRPCEAFTPPHKVAVGETFSAEGKTRQIGIIRAARSDKNYMTGIKKGDWICIAAETLEDIPVDQSRNRIWRSQSECLWLQR